MECMSYSKEQFLRMESTQGRLIKQCMGLSKRSYNTAMLKALNIDKVQNIVNRNVLNLYHIIFKIESPARSLTQFLLARYITYGTTVHGTLIDRVVSIGESPLKCVFRKYGHKVSILKDCIDGHADYIRLLLNSRNYVNHNSAEHFMVRLLTTAMQHIMMYTVCCHVKCAFIYFYIVSYFILNYLRCIYGCTLYYIVFFGNGGLHK